MMLRMLLVLVAVFGLSIAGCEKKEPAVDQAQQDIEEIVEEAENVVEESQK